MFTGLVEECGTVTAIERLDAAARLTFRGPLVTADAAHGDSIAVNGCCLTVTALDRDAEAFSVDVMAESLARTSVGDLVVGSPVNLERALAAGGRMGGHVVQGHVDGTGRLLDRTPSEHWEVLRFSLPPGLARYLVGQGSITVDGVSLTVVDVADDGPEDDPDGGAAFTVSLIPTTLAETTLGALRPGDRVNLEIDILAKYVERLLTAPDHQTSRTQQGRTQKGEPS